MITFLQTYAVFPPALHQLLAVNFVEYIRAICGTVGSVQISKEEAQWFTQYITVYRYFMKIIDTTTEARGTINVRRMHAVDN